MTKVTSIIGKSHFSSVNELSRLICVTRGVNTSDEADEKSECSVKPMINPTEAALKLFYVTPSYPWLDLSVAD